jgi:tRNA nucleotidyltransferase (CCA-adding enzyme)
MTVVIDLGYQAIPLFRGIFVEIKIFVLISCALPNAVFKPVMDDVLWPQYKKYTDLLREMVDTIALDLIDKIYADDKEETIIAGEISCVMG